MTHLSSLLIARISALPFETLDSLAGDRSRLAAEAWLSRLADRADEAERISNLLHAAAGEAGSQGRNVARGAVLQVRRAIHQDRAVGHRLLEEAGPLLTGELQAGVRRHLDHGSEVAQARETFSVVYAEERAQATEAIVQTLEMPLFHLGLRLSGRALARRADGLSRLDPESWDQRSRHAASKVLAYLVRFTTKTSPNGVFCATSLGALTEEPASMSGENQFAALDFLIHVGDARKIAACLAVSPEARAVAIPRVNPTLRRESDHWTLWRPASARRATDDEVRSIVKDHPLLQRFLDAVAGGAGAGRNTERILQEVEERAGRDVRSFYSQLVERGVLIDEVEIPWSERRPLRALAARCPEASWAHELEEVEQDVDSLALLPFQEIERRMDRIAVRLESFPHTRPLAEDDLVRCDASTRLQIHLPRSLLDDLERLVPLYARFYGAIYPETLFRESYADRFLKRYSADTDVPVLDFYHGLFEPEGQARPAAFVSPWSGRSDSGLRHLAGVAFDRARVFFSRRAREAGENSVEVKLSEADWREITGDAPEPRFSCAALFQVAAPSLDDVSALRTRICLNAFFPGAGLSVARLAHLHAVPREANGGSADENPIVRQLREGWARQSRPGAAHAEITFMHGGRTANAGLRPAIFPLEIELPGDRASEEREAIPLADLSARWDSVARRFVVRSQSRGIEILPVISSGINPEGVISFLTMVGAQGLQPLGLFPGFDVPEVRRWPRFTFGNVVLFRRRWVFDAHEVPAAKSAEDHFMETQRWRREHQLPHHVFVHSEGDPKPFYVNLASVALVDLFRRAIGSGKPAPGRVHVTEMLPGPDDLWARDRRGRYASEFLVHLDNRVPARDAG